MPVCRTRLMRLGLPIVLIFMVLPIANHCVAQDDDFAAFSKIGPDGAGHTEAIEAASRLSKLGPDRLLDVLSAIENATPLGKNWLRVVAADVADNGELPMESIISFVADKSASRDARYVGYLLLKGAAPDKADQLLDGMQDDPSLQIRYEAIAKLLKTAESAKGEAAVSMYNQALSFARHPSQLTKIAKALRSADQEVDLAGHMGFLQQWQLVGPFDNTDNNGYAVAYRPELEYLKSPSHSVSQSSYEGKSGQVSWQTHTSKDDLGMVNLNPIFNGEKFAICYGYVELDSPAEQAAQLRLGCIVANKIWVNGDLVMSNEVYHARTGVDQYVDDFTLKAGKNTLLIKTCQNDQSEPWAQDWEFQLRITDPDGAAIRFTR